MFSTNVVDSQFLTKQISSASLAEGIKELRSSWHFCVVTITTNIQLSGVERYRKPL